MNGNGRSELPRGRRGGDSAGLPMSLCPSFILLRMHRVNGSRRNTELVLVRVKLFKNSPGGGDDGATDETN